MVVKMATCRSENLATFMRQTSRNLQASNFCNPQVCPRIAWPFI